VAKRPRVLLVEDDEPTAFARSRVLDQEGFTVVQARTLAGARECFKANRFDIALVDVRLPDGNGYQLCRELHMESAEMPVLLISAAYVDDAATAAATFAGACEFLTEPLSAAALAAALARHLPRVDPPANRR